MNSIYTIEKTCKKIYGKYSKHIDIIIKFTLSFISFWNIVHHFDIIKFLSNPILILGLAIVCAFLPKAFIILISAILILVQLSKISIPVMIVTAALFFVLVVLHFRFSAKLTYLVIITPIFFGLNIPLALPIVVGIATTPSAFVATLCGTISYFIIKNAEMLVNTITEKGSIINDIQTFITKVILSKTLIAYVALFVVAIILVNRIKESRIDYAKEIAICVGTAVLFIGVFIAKFGLKADISVFYSILGIAIGAFCAFIVKTLFVNVDYKKTRYIQYSDDEYYYYVKAVPKVSCNPDDKDEINGQDDGYLD